MFLEEGKEKGHGGGRGEEVVLEKQQGSFCVMAFYIEACVSLLGLP